ncbi:hypothetical protein [Rubritalea squalenifaciens]|uniref:hypothetical protein n=1 Tax=Rubritalea squalenifaciens TaxID=407226 RepID=UPI00116050F1|nr:hypothetical protein [Rubritalea squalenifaciens]
MPNSDDLHWFQNAKGMKVQEVLATYGQPKSRTPMNNGIMRWHYPWLASAYIDFKDGTAVSVFYTAGY